ncbi:hypothetical protein GQ53DRAFT_263780 [Thozetella sp. PMI_491]|nr:hypothetical protein GQ53DRAFT_263780 [Thozetella sp. PMI_491]
MLGHRHPSPQRGQLSTTQLGREAIPEQYAVPLVRASRPLHVAFALVWTPPRCISPCSVRSPESLKLESTSATHPREVLGIRQSVDAVLHSLPWLPGGVNFGFLSSSPRLAAPHVSTGKAGSLWGQEVIVLSHPPGRPHGLPCCRVLGAQYNSDNSDTAMLPHRTYAGSPGIYPILGGKQKPR